MTPEQEFTLSFVLTNTGTETWEQGTVKLGTDLPQDRHSDFYAGGLSGWLSPNRIQMVEASVAPGETATFEAVIQAPILPGVYREDFRPVAEGVQWMTSGPGLWFEVEVAQPGEGQIFVDVPDGHTFYHAANALYEAGLTNGCQQIGDDLYYCPDVPLKRQDGVMLLARWLYRYGGYHQLPPLTGVFPDVTGDGEPQRAIELAFRDGVVFGFDDGTFRPDDPMTREQAILIIMRALLKHTEPTPIGDHFSDTDNPYIEMAGDLGIVNTANPIFDPDGLALRGHMAAFMCRAFLSGEYQCDEPPIDSSPELFELREEARFSPPRLAICFTAAIDADEHIPDITITEDGMPVCYVYEASRYEAGHADLVVDHIEVQRLDTNEFLVPGDSVPSNTPIRIESHHKNIGHLDADDFGSGKIVTDGIIGI
jgi:hypothetical protein